MRLGCSNVEQDIPKYRIAEPNRAGERNRLLKLDTAEPEGNFPKTMRVSAVPWTFSRTNESLVPYRSYPVHPLSSLTRFSLNTRETTWYLLISKQNIIAEPVCS